MNKEMIKITGLQKKLWQSGGFKGYRSDDRRT